MKYRFCDIIFVASLNELMTVQGKVMTITVKFNYIFDAIGGVMTQKWEILADVEIIPAMFDQRELTLVTIKNIEEMTLGYSLGPVSLQEVPEDILATLRGYAIQHARRVRNATTEAGTAIEQDRADDMRLRQQRAEY